MCVEGGIFKISYHDFTFIREMRVTSVKHTERNKNLGYFLIPAKNLTIK